MGSKYPGQQSKFLATTIASSLRAEAKTKAWSEAIFPTKKNLIKLTGQKDCRVVPPRNDDNSQLLQNFLAADNIINNENNVTF